MEKNNRTLYANWSGLENLSSSTICVHWAQWAVKQAIV